MFHNIQAYGVLIAYKLYNKIDKVHFIKYKLIC